MYFTDFTQSIQIESNRIAMKLKEKSIGKLALFDRTVNATVLNLSDFTVDDFIYYYYSMHFRLKYYIFLSHIHYIQLQM